jgi:hypothetical protein
MTVARIAPEVRFWRHVEKRDQSSCWLWHGGKGGGGYGRFRLGGKRDGQIGPHIFSYRIHKGEIPDGLFVLHECDNPACVNPAHLSLGTQKKNISDCRDRRRLKGHFQNGPDVRRRKGSAHPVSKLTEAQIPAIRADGRANKLIAAEYGVDDALIKRIKDRRAWKHV